MTRFGFVLDQRPWIGCHACTVACKEEHGVFYVLWDVKQPKRVIYLFTKPR